MYEILTLVPLGAIRPRVSTTVSYGSVITKEKENYKRVKEELLGMGKMCVFDERITVDISHNDPSVVGKDWFDGTPCEHLCQLWKSFLSDVTSEEMKTNTSVDVRMSARMPKSL